MATNKTFNINAGYNYPARRIRKGFSDPMSADVLKTGNGFVVYRVIDAYGDATDKIKVATEAGFRRAYSDIDTVFLIGKKLYKGPILKSNPDAAKAW